VGADRVFELARHLTERDREVALCLYDQQVLTTDQLTLLFFSTQPEGPPTRPARRRTRRAQGRPSLGDRAVRHRLGRGPDDAADARRVR
jgi:hypothetical protein